MGNGMDVKVIFLKDHTTLAEKALTSVQSEQERLRVVQLRGVPSEAGARERSRSGQSLGGYKGDSTYLGQAGPPLVGRSLVVRVSPKKKVPRPLEVWKAKLSERQFFFLRSSRRSGVKALTSLRQPFVTCNMDDGARGSKSWRSRRSATRKNQGCDQRDRVGRLSNGCQA